MEKIKKIILLIAGLLLGLLAAEISLSILNKPRFYKNHSTPAQFAFIKPDNNQQGPVYLNIPGQNIRFIYDGNPRGYFDKGNQIDHVTNSWGFRGEEFSAEKPAHTFRIAFIGDSFTFGEGVKFPDTYPEQASLILNQKYASVPVDFESYNFGIGGYNTKQELFILESIALKTSPDAVVLKYDLSEAEPPLYKIGPAASGLARIPRWYEASGGLFNPLPPDVLIYKFRLPRLLWQAIRNNKQSRVMVSYYKSLFQENSPGWGESRAALHRMIKLCRENNIPCYVIYFPALYSLNDLYPFKDIHAMVKKEVEMEGAAFIDLFPYLKNRNAATLWVHPSDHHPNEIVHKIAAIAITDAITKTNQKILGQR
ncbi:MAG: SGNH/GDSL hydrolase family protein [Candidatus Omnitrophota bacterium]